MFWVWLLVRDNHLGLFSRGCIQDIDYDSLIRFKYLDREGSKGKGTGLGQISKPLYLLLEQGPGNLGKDLCVQSVAELFQFALLIPL